MALYLTLDLGTTLYKVALFDDAGKLLGVERARPPIRHSQQARVEVDQLEFFKPLMFAAGKLRAAVGERWNEIAAVSFATQANSFTFLDASLRQHWSHEFPLILWTDTRASSLPPLEVPDDFRRRTGMPRFGPALALMKVLWLRKNEPERLTNAKRFLFISDFLTMALTNRHVTEAGVAGLSGALDVQTLQWWDEMLARVEIPPIKMPAVERAGTDLGTITEFWRMKFDLPESCRLIMGCLDQYAGAIGTGTMTPGAICETTGTVLAAVRCTDHLDDDPAPSVFQGPAWDEKHFWQMSFSSTSANLLEWYRNSLPDRPAYEELSRLAGDAKDSDLIVEPFEAGKPIEQCFRHVRPEHTRGEIVRAIMRRVAESLKTQIADLTGGEMPNEIRSAGGAARSDVWLQIKADTLKTKFVAMECEEPTSLGAAMLAHHGVTGESLESIAKRWVKVRATFQPR
jgi:xylulokinase